MLKDKLHSRKAQDLRQERDELGFVRQPAVRWLSPGLLARSGVEVIVSGTFGRFADKREIQREPQVGRDYADAGELWVDFLSDTGDGWEATYTMAWLLARPSLEAGGEQLPRGGVLLLGGDQVYPSATPEQYEDRFIGPFAAALPYLSDNPDKPDMYALPGNHDWYDGLVSFLRVFCTGEKQVGDWRTRQRRSYFAIKLPNDWWIWAIDIQLDTYIDDVQLDYFRDQQVTAGDKVILMTAKPSWVKAVPERAEPASWRYLSFFEERVVRAMGAKLVITLTGDLHHYARYEPAGAGADDAPTRITAGGGGAYLSPTHTLKQTLDVRSLHHDASVTYDRAQIYPREKDSRRLSNGILKLARLNPSFAAFLGAVYVVLGLALLAALDAAEGPLLDAADGFPGFLSSAAGAMSIVPALVLLGALYGTTDIVPDALEVKRGKRGATRLARLLVALLHAVIHLLLAAGIVYLAVSIAPDDAPIVAWLVSVALLFAAGLAVGATVFAIFLLAIHKARGSKAPGAANQVFTGQSIADYKNLVRMRFAANGSLTLYPLGVDRVGRDWDHMPGGAPRFEPRGAAPRVHPIDGPLRFDASGRRAYSDG